MTLNVRDIIETSGLGPGDRLPPERELAQKLGMSRSLVRRTLLRLEKEGKIVRYVGRGTFIAGAEPTSSISAGIKIAPVNTDIRVYPAEVFETRLILEPQIARFAAHRATAQETIDMQKILQDAREVTTMRDFELQDAAFHKLIVQAARNQLLSALYEAIHEVRSGELWGRIKEQTLNEARMEHYSSQHDEILNAIMEKDADRAEEAMRKHVQDTRKNIIERKNSI